MSAYICNPEQIALLAVYCAGPEQRGLGGNCVPYSLRKEGVVDATSLALLLLTQNIDAVKNRYGDEPVEELPGPGLRFEKLTISVMDYTRKYLKKFPSVGAAALAGIIDCYEYQTSELDDYESSPAYAVCSAMVRELLRNAFDANGRVWSWRDAA